jgi:hypothetical protein
VERLLPGVVPVQAVQVGAQQRRVLGQPERIAPIGASSVGARGGAGHRGHSAVLRRMISSGCVLGNVRT